MESTSYPPTIFPLAYPIMVPIDLTVDWSIPAPALKIELSMFFHIESGSNQTQPDRRPGLQAEKLWGIYRDKTIEIQVSVPFLWYWNLYVGSPTDRRGLWVDQSNQPLSISAYFNIWHWKKKSHKKSFLLSFNHLTILQRLQLKNLPFFCLLSSSSQ